MVLDSLNSSHNQGDYSPAIYCEPTPNENANYLGAVISYCSFSYNKGSECIELVQESSSYMLNYTNIISNNGYSIILSYAKTTLQHVSVLGNIGDVIFKNKHGGFEIINSTIGADQIDGEHASSDDNFIITEIPSNSFINQMFFIETGSCVAIPDAYQSLSAPNVDDKGNCIPQTCIAKRVTCFCNRARYSVDLGKVVCYILCISALTMNI